MDMAIFLGLATVFFIGYVCGSMATVKTIHKHLTNYFVDKGRTHRVSEDLSKSIITNKYK